MSPTSPSLEIPVDSGDSQDSQQSEDNPRNSPTSDLSSSLATNDPSPASPSTPYMDSPTPQSSPPPTTAEPTPSSPPEDDQTSPSSSPPPTSPPPAKSPTPPANSPPPLSATPPPPSATPPPPSATPPPPEVQNVFSPPPPTTAKSSPPPSQNPPQIPSPPTPASSNTHKKSPPPPPFVAPPNSGTTPVPSSSPLPSPPSSNSPPTLSPPSAIATSPSPPSIVSPQSIVPPGPPSTYNSSPSQQQSSRSETDGGLGTGATVVVTLVVVSVFLGILGTVAFCVWKRKKRSSGQNIVYIMPASTPESGNNSDSTLLKAQSAPRNRSGSGKVILYSPPAAGGFGNSRSWFTYNELVEATNGFSYENLLGEGGFGSVYKGKLADGRDIAVKQLKIGGGQGEREFRSEVEIISRIHHRHLVSLVGYCISENRRLLIYDYVPNNNLYFHLHGESRPVMDWATRVKIAIGAARGLTYLHEDCHPRIIHRDIKSSNILLDEKFEARVCPTSGELYVHVFENIFLEFVFQVSDFGLAKLAKDTNTHVTTRVMGTFGYMAPEYASSGKLTEKSDVYSYGVVLLELITGRKPLDSSQDESLVEWARPLLSQALETQEFGGLADPKLGKNYVDSEMFQMIEAAAACVRHSSAKRPKMGQVVRSLDSILNEDLTNGMKVGESALFNNSEQSAQIKMFRKMAFGTQDYSIDSWGSESTQVNSPSG